MKQKFFVALSVLLLCLSVCLSACGGHSGGGGGGADTIALAPCPVFEEDSAMMHIQAQCDFGPRVMGTEAAQLCGDYIAERFRQYGATVVEQNCTVTLYDDTKVPARNIIASIHPEALDRILFCAHWDSRPWADNDPDEANWHTPILAANDGASGVAVLLEICRLIQQKPVSRGIDFVCFDAEDAGTPEWAEDPADGRDTWCLGSQYWAQQALEANYKARYGVLLDMVGGRGCTFAREQVSRQYADPVVELIWHLAHQIGYGHFFPLTDGGCLVDDHVNVNRIARIPCLDIVPYFVDGPSNFGPTWHTLQDTPENIDPRVLKAVGQTITQLIYNDNAEE